MSGQRGIIIWFLSINAFLCLFQDRSYYAISMPQQRRFEFIPVSGKERRTDSETLRRVHSHTQAEYRRRHASKHRQKTVELDVTPLLDRSLVQHHGHSLSIRLDNSRSDPFQSFKLGEDRRAHRLWDHGAVLSKLPHEYFLTIG
jgi:hypothetical protein